MLDVQLDNDCANGGLQLYLRSRAERHTQSISRSSVAGTRRVRSARAGSLSSLLAAHSLLEAKLRQMYSARCSAAARPAGEAFCSGGCRAEIERDGHEAPTHCRTKASVGPARRAAEQSAKHAAHGISWGYDQP